MTRRLINLATVLSLVLLLTVVVLWVRSYRSLDQYLRVDGASGRLEGVVLLYGGVQVARVDNMGNRLREANLTMGPGWTSIPLESFGRAPSLYWQLFYGRNVTVRLEFLGFRWFTGSLGPGDSMWSVRIPLWLPASAFALLPALWLSKRLRRRRPGLCPRCGYDLRATPDRCPECGAVAPPQLA